MVIHVTVIVTTSCDTKKNIEGSGRIMLKTAEVDLNTFYFILFYITCLVTSVIVIYYIKRLRRRFIVVDIITTKVC